MMFLFFSYIWNMLTQELSELGNFWGFFGNNSNKEETKKHFLE